MRAQGSLTGQLASVDEDLTGRENLILVGRLLGLRRSAAKRRADELLEAFDITAAAGRLVKHYSGGMRRRLDIAASIVVIPKAPGASPLDRRRSGAPFDPGGGRRAALTRWRSPAPPFARARPAAARASGL